MSAQDNLSEEQFHLFRGLQKPASQIHKDILGVHWTDNPEVAEQFGSGEGVGGYLHHRASYKGPYSVIHATASKDAVEKDENKLSLEKGQQSIARFVQIDSPQLQSPLLEDKNEQKEDQSHQSLSCQSHDCTKTAQFCYEDEAAARYCSDHKLEGMIERIRTQEQCDPPNKVDNSWVRKATLEKWKSEKEWLNFKVLQQKHMQAFK